MEDVGPLIVSIVVNEISGDFSDNFTDLTLEVRTGVVLQKQENLLFQLDLAFCRKLGKKLEFCVISQVLSMGKIHSLLDRILGNLRRKRGAITRLP